MKSLFFTLFFAVFAIFAAKSQNCCTDQIEMFASSHYVQIPTFGQSNGAEGLRITIGGIYAPDPENIDDRILFEIGYQRVGARGFHEDHRSDDFETRKLLLATAGYGMSYGKASVYIAGTIGKHDAGIGSTTDPGVFEVGLIGIVTPFKINRFSVGFRGDMMYQVTGQFSVTQGPKNNFPWRMSGGLFASYKF